MTDKPKSGDSGGEAELERLLADAFASKGELIPTTEAEVARAERAGLEHQGALPESLREYRPDAPGLSASGKVVRLDERRGARSLVTHLAAGLIGAAAAAALFVSRERTPAPGGALPTGEPRRQPDAGLAEPRIAVGRLRECMKPCCAGSACAEARDDLKACGSDRPCVACAIEELARSRYRVRLGAFAPTAAGKTLVDRAGALELCVRVGSSELACGPAHAAADCDQTWTVLPLVVSTQDALAGFVLEVRARATRQVLGAWQSPVTLNANVLCKGLFVKPKTAAGDALGVVSIFLDDAHYVELGRAERVEPLASLSGRLELVDVKSQLVETSKPGAERFALVLGPLDQPTAERLRWALLDRGQSARLVVGEDHVGAPRPAP